MPQAQAAGTGPALPPVPTDPEVRLHLQYVLTFLEGIISFVQPCLLPMLPIYLSYLAGGAQRDTKKTVQCAAGFILGFTVIFVILGIFAGLLGGLLLRYQVVVNIVAGAIVVLFGLNILGVLNIRFINKSGSGRISKGNVTGFFSAVAFGCVFSISWTPCVGAFLASALTKASLQGSMIQGALMLLCFSLGMGIPFFLSAILIDKLKSAFDWIKRHYKAVNLVSGIFLIIIGVLMMAGLMNRFLAILTF